MAVAKTETGLPLDRFAEILGIHPLHFNQVNLAGVALPNCGRVWLQYDWQGPTAISRESVAIAIANAELRLETFLGFPVYPKWYDNIQQPVTGNPIVLPKAHFMYGGVKTKTLIEEETSVEYEDVDGDSFYNEVATISIPTDVTDPSEIAVYYPGETGNDDWRIHNLNVTIADGEATIKGARHQFVIKNELEALKPAQVEGTDDGKFLDSVDVYRVWTNPATQAILRSCNACGGHGCKDCSFNEFPACLVADDHENSIVNANPASWNGTRWIESCCTEKAYSTRTFFRAGWHKENIWDRVVAYLALTELDAGLCECPTVQQRLKYWMTDLSEITTSQRFNYRFYLPANVPWGWTRGALYALSIAQKYRKPQGL